MNTEQQIEVHQCEHEGCNSKDAIQCHLIDYGDFKSEPKDVFFWYCVEHCHDEGFCYFCGEFWGGCEEFDFASSHLCPNCKSEIDSEEDDYDSECDFGEF